MSHPAAARRRARPPVDTLLLPGVLHEQQRGPCLARRPPHHPPQLPPAVCHAWLIREWSPCMGCHPTPTPHPQAPTLSPPSDALSPAAAASRAPRVADPGVVPLRGPRRRSHPRRGALPPRQRADSASSRGDARGGLWRARVGHQIGGGAGPRRGGGACVCKGCRHGGRSRGRWTQLSAGTGPGVHRACLARHLSGFTPRPCCLGGWGSVCKAPWRRPSSPHPASC